MSHTLLGDLSTCLLRTRHFEYYNTVTLEIRFFLPPQDHVQFFPPLQFICLFSYFSKLILQRPYFLSHVVTKFPIPLPLQLANDLTEISLYANIFVHPALSWILKVFHWNPVLINGWFWQFLPAQKLFKWENQFLELLNLPWFWSASHFFYFHLEY